jgi:hypothetical protein
MVRAFSPCQRKIRTKLRFENIAEAKQAAEKVGIGPNCLRNWGYKTITDGQQIAPWASLRDLFFAVFRKWTFSAACKAHPFLPLYGTTEVVP